MTQGYAAIPIGIAIMTINHNIDFLLWDDFYENFFDGSDLYSVVVSAFARYKR